MTRGVLACLPTISGGHFFDFNNYFSLERPVSENLEAALVRLAEELYASISVPGPLWNEGDSMKAKYLIFAGTVVVGLAQVLSAWILSAPTQEARGAFQRSAPSQPPIMNVPDNRAAQTPKPNIAPPNSLAQNGSGAGGTVTDNSQGGGYIRDNNGAPSGSDNSKRVPGRPQKSISYDTYTPSYDTYTPSEDTYPTSGSQATFG